MPKAKRAPAAGEVCAAQPYCCPVKKAACPKKSHAVEPVSIAEMREVGATNRAEFTKSKQTLMQYNRYIKQGKEFLAECVKRQRASNEAAPEGMDNELLEKAFENPPNKLSSEALELFLVQKCLMEEHRERTAATVQAAFAWYWDNMLVGLIFCLFWFNSRCLAYRDGDRYAGKQYLYDEGTGEVRGCPARAPAIKTLIKVVKAKCSADGISRRSAEPMTVEDLAQIINWSEKLSPPNQPAESNKQEEFLTATKHAMMRAYMATGFTLWTR